jgi:hypothetical protein
MQHERHFQHKRPLGAVVTSHLLAACVLVRTCSPGSMIRDAAAYLRFSRTPRTAGTGGNRVSVNPLSRAAGDANYKATKEVKGSGNQHT